MTVVIFLSCTAHIRNSCLPSIQTYRKPGASSDLRWPRLPQSLARVNVVSLFAHHLMSECPEDPGDCQAEHATRAWLEAPLLFLSKMKLASVCRLLWSLLSFQLPFFSSASLLQRAHKGCSYHLNLAGMFLPGGWLTVSPGVLKWKSFLTILYLELNPFLPCSSGMFYFSPGNLTLSMTMCVFSSYFLYGLTHPTSCKSLEQGFCLMYCASNHLLHRQMTEREFVGSVSYCNPWSVHQDVWWSVSYIYETPLGTP